MVNTGLQIRVQHWGDDRQILVICLILGGGMFLRFLAMSKVMLFLLIFSTLFLMTFFLLVKLFSHISCKNPLKSINIYHISHFPSPKIFCHGGSILAMGKNQNYWGDGGQILGGCIPSSPRDLQPWANSIIVKVPF